MSICLSCLRNTRIEEDSDNSTSSKDLLVRNVFEEDMEHEVRLRALLACYRRDASYDSSLRLSKNVFEELPRRQAFSVVGVRKIWRTLSVSEGQRLESHTKTLMERASSRNQLSPLPKIGEGFGEWSEAPSYEEGVGGDGDLAAQLHKSEGRRGVQALPCKNGMKG